MSAGKRQRLLIVTALLAALTPLVVMLSGADLLPVSIAGTTIDLSKAALLALMGGLVGYLVASTLKSEDA